MPEGIRITQKLLKDVPEGFAVRDSYIRFRWIPDLNIVRSAITKGMKGLEGKDWRNALMFCLRDFVDAVQKQFFQHGGVLSAEWPALSRVTVKIKEDLGSLTPEEPLRRFQDLITSATSMSQDAIVTKDTLAKSVSPPYYEIHAKGMGVPQRPIFQYIPGWLMIKFRSHFKKELDETVYNLVEFINLYATKHYAEFAQEDSQWRGSEIAWGSQYGLGYNMGEFAPGIELPGIVQQVIGRKIR